MPSSNAFSNIISCGPCKLISVLAIKSPIILYIKMIYKTFDGAMPMKKYKKINPPSPTAAASAVPWIYFFFLFPFFCFSGIFIFGNFFCRKNKYNPIKAVNISRVKTGQ
jgi:hypothetical protein